MPGVPAPPLILAGFGFGAGAGYITTPIPFASQQPNPRASYTDGFPPQTVGNTATAPPDVRDVNGILNAVSANIAATSAGQLFPFNSSISSQNGGYAGGAIIATADGSGFWLNTSSGNTNNPDTAPAATSGWVPLSQYGLTAITGLTNANVTLTAPQAARPIITFSGTLTGNVQIVFPTWTNSWLVTNNTTGNYSLTCKTSAGSGIIVLSGQTCRVWGDGTNINGTAFQTGTFTATLTGPYSGSGITGTLYWIISQGIAFIRAISDIQSSTISSAFISINLPQVLSPTAGVMVPTCGLIISNVTNGYGTALITPGTPPKLTLGVGVNNGSSIQGNQPFPNGGADGTGVAADFCVSYPMR